MADTGMINADLISAISAAVSVVISIVAFYQGTRAQQKAVAIELEALDRSEREALQRKRDQAHEYILNCILVASRCQSQMAELESEALMEGFQQIAEEANGFAKNYEEQLAMFAELQTKIGDQLPPKDGQAAFSEWLDKMMPRLRAAAHDSALAQDWKYIEVQRRAIFLTKRLQALNLAMPDLDVQPGVGLS